MGLEPPFSLDGKGTVTVISDIAGTAVSQGLTQGVTVAFRDVDGDFIELVLRNGNQPSTSVRPNNPARTSLTPPSALSRLVWAL